MAFASNRDLVILEPNLFRDIAFAGQRLINASDGVVSGTTLTSASSDFEAAGVGAGDVVLIADVPAEVVTRDSPTALTVSRLRPDVSGPAIAPSPGTNLRIEIVNFGPQIELVHRQVMRTVGIEPDDPNGVVSVAMVINGSMVAHIEALGTIYMLMAGASALIGRDGVLWNKAKLYRDRFDGARQRARVELDLDSDGVAEVTRFMNVVQFTRS